ncbi:MAG TPA: hypothetical protein VG983_02935, partial [Caulobacterales bacterium]|nr:hypothetical protein [Caulobacterales bacterium]
MNAFEFAAARAPLRDAGADMAPTPLLAHLAGDHAAAIARLWPSPHADFLTLPAARRHIVAMSLPRLPIEQWAALRDRAERAPLRDALAFALRPIPRGLARAVGRLGEMLWAQHEYRLLLALLA